MNKITAAGGGVELIDENLFSVVIPRINQWEGLFHSMSGQGIVPYTTDLGNAIILLGEIDSLDLSIDGMTDESAALIVGQKRYLRRLKISLGPGRCSELINALRQRHSLLYLDLECPDLTNADVARLSHLSSLETLIIRSSPSGLSKIDNGMLPSLKDFKALIELGLYGTGVTQEAAIAFWRETDLPIELDSQSIPTYGPEGEVVFPAGEPVTPVQ